MFVEPINCNCRWFVKLLYFAMCRNLVCIVCILAYKQFKRQVNLKRTELLLSTYQLVNIAELCWNARTIFSVWYGFQVGPRLWYCASLQRCMQKSHVMLLPEKTKRLIFVFFEIKTKFPVLLGWIQRVIVSTSYRHKSLLWFSLFKIASIFNLRQYTSMN